MWLLHFPPQRTFSLKVCAVVLTHFCRRSPRAPQRAVISCHEVLFGAAEPAIVSEPAAECMRHHSWHSAQVKSLSVMEQKCDWYRAFSASRIFLSYLLIWSTCYAEQSLWRKCNKIRSFINQVKGGLNM